ncbi:MAG: hypothetical protein ACJAS1_004776 [Oleiphilaceae bacterium]|jgi:hypothetical protein
MQADILSQIKKMKNIRDVVILTHNIDFIFLQTVLLAALKRCGHPSLIVFSDAKCTQESFAKQVKFINDLGSRYRVIPVSMNPGFRFHPKSILLSGDSESYLYTGSGNLTFGGYRENGEVWNKYEVKGGIVPAEFSSMKKYLSAILPYVGLPDEVGKDIADVFHEDRHSWVKALPPAGGLWFQPGFGGSLLQRMENKLSGREIKSIRVCTPYFDIKAKALNQLSASFGNPPVEVYIQSKRSTLLQTTADTLSSNIVIKSLLAKCGDEPSNRFVHAKWYAFDMGDGIELFSGSANCSNAALLLSGNQGNAELMAESTMSYQEFSDAILSELLISDETPELIEGAGEDEADELSGDRLSISCARYSYGKLVIAYRVSKQTLITGLMIDDKEIALSSESIIDSRIECVVDSRPKQVVLIGEIDGGQVTSNTMWVDDESLLRSNSSSRQIIDAIQNVQDCGEDDPRRWIMLFDLVSQNFQHRSSRETARVSAKGSGEAESFKLHKDLLVSKVYRHGLSFPLVNLNSTNQSQSIYSLLRSSFGLNGQDSVEEKLVDENTSGDGEVDQPDKKPMSSRPKNKIEPSKKQRSRLLALTSSIIDEICQSDFVLVRELELLSRDLQLLAILLRKLYSMGWIEEAEFFHLTHKAWSQLFFSTKDDISKGAIQIRFEASPEPHKFIEQFVTPSLVAALYGWFSALPVSVTDVYAYRFILSQLMAMGRCPWLWNLNNENQQQVMKQLDRIWMDSPCPSQHTTLLDDQMSQFLTLVESLSKQGLAMTSFENEMASHDLTFIRDTINTPRVKRGDIIWQGKAGLCVTLEDNQNMHQLDVLSLQRPEKKATFRADMIIPIKSVLLHTEFFSETFISEHKHLLDQFIVEYDLADIVI